MHGNLTPGYGLWLEPLVALAVGTAVTVGTAALACRLVKSALWQRTLWQAATVGLLLLVIVELTGTASAVVRLVRIEKEEVAPQPSPPRASARVEPSPTSRSQAPAWERTSSRLRFAARQSTLTQPDPTAATFYPRVPSSFSSPTPALQPTNENDPVPKPELGNRDAGVEPANQDLEAPPQEDHTALRPLGYEPLVVQSPAAGRPSTVTPSSADSDHPWWPGLIWALGACAIVGRLAWARSMLCVFRRRHGVVSDAALLKRVDRLARRLGIRRRVKVLEACGLNTPVAFGAFRPTLALPAGFSSEFEPRQQEAILVHELAHLTGGDPAWQGLADLACAVLWWHPLSWWSRRRLRAANEVAADEASLVIPEGPDVLASCLVAMGRRLAGRSPWRLGWVAANGPGFRSALGRRVERLLTLPARSWRMPGRVRGLLAKTTLVVVLLIVAILSTAWARSQATYPEGGPMMNVLSTSWRHSVAAAALVAFVGPLAGEAPAQERERERAPNLFENRERDAGPRDRPRAENPEREAMARQVEVLRLAIHALAEAERGDAAELVERAIRAREVTLEGRRDDEAHQIRERNPEPGQLAEILGMAADLWRKFNNEDNAHAVAQLADELRAPRDREPRGEREARERGRREMPERERDEIARRMDELRGALERARREGREEEAGRIVREIEEIEQHMARREGDRRPPDAPPAEAREEMERRMEHLRVAIDNLHAAGLHEQAERLAHQAEQLLLGRPGPERGAGPQPEPPFQPKGPRPGEPDPMIVEMGNQIRHLNQRLEEMGRQMEQQIMEMRRHIEEMGGAVGRELEEHGREVDRKLDAVGREMDEQLEVRHRDTGDDDDEGDDEEDDDDDEDDDEDEDDD